VVEEGIIAKVEVIRTQDATKAMETVGGIISDQDIISKEDMLHVLVDTPTKVEDEMVVEADFNRAKIQALLIASTIEIIIKDMMVIIIKIMTVIIINHL